MRSRSSHGHDPRNHGHQRCRSREHRGGHDRAGSARLHRQTLQAFDDPLEGSRALADENAVIELRDKTIERLKLGDLEYAPLAGATVPVLDRLSSELVAALRARNAKAVRAISERVNEPAALFGGRLAIAAACRVLNAGSDLEALNFGSSLVAELGELLAALQRVAAVHTIS